MVSLQTVFFLFWLGTAGSLLYLYLEIRELKGFWIEIKRAEKEGIVKAVDGTGDVNKDHPY